MSWAYFCESCKTLRGYMYKPRPKQCGACGSKKIDIDAVGSLRLLKRRLETGSSLKGAHTLTVDKLPDGSRIVHNIGSSTPKVKRANGTYEPIAPGQTVSIAPDDILVEGEGFTPHAV